MDHGPEHVARPGIIRAALRRDVAHRRAAEDDVKAGSEDVRKDDHDWGNPVRNLSRLPPMLRVMLHGS